MRNFLVLRGAPPLEPCVVGHVCSFHQSIQDGRILSVGVNPQGPAPRGARSAGIDTLRQGAIAPLTIDGRDYGCLLEHGRFPVALALAVERHLTLLVIEQKAGDGVVVAFGVPLLRGPLEGMPVVRARPGHAALRADIRHQGVLMAPRDSKSRISRGLMT